MLSASFALQFGDLYHVIAQLRRAHLCPHLSRCRSSERKSGTKGSGKHWELRQKHSSELPELCKTWNNIYAYVAMEDCLEEERYGKPSLSRFYRVLISGKLYVVKI